MTEVELPFGGKKWPGIAKLLSANIRDGYELESTVDRITACGSAYGLADTFHECMERYPVSMLPLLPGLQRAILQYAASDPHLSGLATGSNAETTISRRAVHALLACMVFCVIDDNNAQDNDYPTFSMLGAYRHTNYTLLRFLFEYFACVEERPSLLDGTITINRRVVDKMPTADKTVGDVQTFDGRCEDAPGDYVVVFSNRYIGGSVLSAGRVQEEILFMTHPEMIITRLLCQKMGDRDAIVVRGARRFGNYTGYGLGLCFASRGDLHPRSFTCIDAKPADGIAQFVVDFDRDMVKAYAGFARLETEFVPSVATGKWGSGAFGKDPQLSFVQQYLAAAAAGVYLLYCVYDDPQMIKQVDRFVAATRGQTLRQVYTAYKRANNYSSGVFDAVLEQLQRTAKN